MYVCLFEVRKLSPISIDRKSTRLNSSHGYISYAVFCLKKKKKTDTTIAMTILEIIDPQKSIYCLQHSLPYARVIDGGVDRTESQLFAYRHAVDQSSQM